MSHYSFEFPYAFLLLPLFWFCAKECPLRRQAIYMPYIHVLLGDKRVKSRILELLKWIAILSFITALASPVKVIEYNNVKKEGRDIMLVLDTSKSMEDRGFDSDNPKRDKFSVMVEVVSKFIAKRESDRVGLINFASSAFIASPLTFDKNYLLDILKKQRVGLVGSRTAIYDSLLEAEYLLSASEAKSKIVILLTDGMDNMSKTTFADILAVSKKSDIKLYIIGIGGEHDIDRQKLEELAKAANGKFYFVSDKGALEKIYEEIDKAETTAIKSESYKRYFYFYYYPLVVAIVFFLMFVYFRSVKGIAK
jgi:Ca-activated chloride channel family protein